jgi:hypothetical protein
MLRLHLSIEEANKAASDVTEIVVKNALAIYSPHVDTEQGKPKVTVVRTRISAVKNRLGKFMQKLYDLEPSNEPEKPLNVDLGVDLYQMEDW